MNDYPCYVNDYPCSVNDLLAAQNPITSKRTAFSMKIGCPLLFLKRWNPLELMDLAKKYLHGDSIKITVEIWSECRDSNSGPPAPKGAPKISYNTFLHRFVSLFREIGELLNTPALRCPLCPITPWVKCGSKILRIY